MESTIKPFDIRSIPIQAVSEPVKSLADIKKVTVQMDGSTEGVEVVHYTPYSLKKCNDMDTTYTLVKLPDDSSAVTGTLSCAMKYTVKDCDPATGEPDNEEG
ncbi:unnamed protein product [Rotaria sp. Silwood2]|nr:unnamed protein product [Rotaria sp. Silwood2]